MTQKSLLEKLGKQTAFLEIWIKKHYLFIYLFIHLKSII